MRRSPPAAPNTRSTSTSNLGRTDEFAWFPWAVHAGFDIDSPFQLEDGDGFRPRNDNTALGDRRLGVVATLVDKLSFPEAALRSRLRRAAAAGAARGAVNGRPRWTAPVEVGDLISPVGEVLSRFQPSQRYFLLDEGRWEEDDLPRRNLVSALVGLKNSRSAASLSNVLEALSDWVEGPGEDELRRAFVEWVRQAVLPGRFGEAVLPVVQALEGGGAMLAERVKEWTEQWLREGREQGLQQGLERGREQGLERGIERGRAEERALLCRQASR